MEFCRKIIVLHFILLLAFLVTGCASLAKFVIGQNGIEIPQIVAHLEPSLAANKITLAGKLVIQNPTKSTLSLEKIYLEIRGENKLVLEKAVLDWENSSVSAKHELEAQVKIDLGLSALNNKDITVFIRTGFTYKQFGLHIPVESKVAVLHLDALKETIARPFYVNILTKLHSSLFGNSSIDFDIAITNPLSIGLVLEDGLITVNTLEGRNIAKSKIARAFFKGSQSNQIKGSVKIGNIWGRLIRGESAKRRPLKFQLSGNMRIPNTDIFIPFKIESVVEIKFSF